MKEQNLTEAQTMFLTLQSLFLLAVDDLGQTVSPHAALCLAAGLQHVLLPSCQSPHT